mgnify:CR=1 FL=1
MNLKKNLSQKNNFFYKNFLNHISIVDETFSLIPQIEKSYRLILKTIKSNGTIFFIGNGGSAADCQHIAAELIGRFKINRKPIKALALTTDSSILTAISNDFDYNQVFSRQLEGLSKTNDLLFAISTSGKSKNIIRVITESKKKGIKVIGITGQSGHDMDGLCDILICVPASRPDRIQEMHIAVGQILCEIIENTLC